MEEFNFIVENGNELEGDDELFFQTKDVVRVKDVDIFDILVRAGIFPSKGQARKNWKLTGEKIPDGFSDFQKLGKLNKRITILNAIKC